MTPIYKIISTAEWAVAQAVGRFDGSEVDLHDGYIHFSTAEQCQATARKWFSGRDDLMLLTVDPAGLDLRWEPARGGDLFPHVYGALPVAAVVDAQPMSTPQPLG